MLDNKFILDACCSVKAMWYNKNHPNAVYIDIRKEPSGFLGHGRKEQLNPDYVMDFRKMDFPDKSFKLVVFDPPHLIGKEDSCRMIKQYGCLSKETWQDDIKRGFDECWRCLDDYGILVFKWSDSSVKRKEVLETIGKTPLFGHPNGSKIPTHWFCFMKIPNALKGKEKVE